MCGRALVIISKQIFTSSKETLLLRNTKKFCERTFLLPTFQIVLLAFKANGFLCKMGRGRILQKKRLNYLMNLIQTASKIIPQIVPTLIQLRMFGLILIERLERLEV